jgi:hypothetical protein
LPNITLHVLAISEIRILREVRRRNHTELADFFEGVDLGIAQKIGAVADVMSARRITACVVARVLV